ncbi:MULTISPECIES: MDR family MFS transporter [Inquilinus]|uniref:EmrB/QacA subfamily drug resistance transporter n=1 Tax=Inquilinus ginsengisoli TaxID=363840 RepID=A0ABU1JSV1_9PROT|nr:MDR family MFS transporter [Inquilinus ginsengisoli]MDR6291706.1 EmrB/QacA subfamily drug resistance transporter [Inquilinus ginsengisoli]
MSGPQAAAPAEATAREIRFVLLGLMIVLGLSALDQNIVATALPSIVGDLGGGIHLSWVVTAYVLASTSVMPLYGKLSDQYGRKPMLYVAILAFLLGSALSGAAQSMTQLIVFRAIQGLGAGGLMPLAQTIIGDLVPPARRGRQQGSVAAVFAVCSVVGPALGGAITDLLSWHWIFYVNLPIGAVALAVVSRALRRPHLARRRRIDYAGAVLLTGATTAFLLVLTLGGSQFPWASPEILGIAAATAILALLFAVQARRAPEPVLPLHLRGNRVFAVACLVLALTFMGLLGASVFFPLFFQLVLGIGAARSGLLTGPLMIGLVAAAIVNGRVLLPRSGRYKPAQTGGLALAALAFAVLAWAVASVQGLAVIEPALIAIGIGLGLVMPNMTIAVQNAVPREDMGAATATLAFCRSLGGAIGVAGAGAILAARLGTGAPGTEGLAQEGLRQLAALPPEAHAAAVAVYRHAIAGTFAAGAAIVALALAAILFLPELPLRSSHAPAKG